MAVITIGGNRFEVAQLALLRSLYLQPRLAPVIAEVGAALWGIIATAMSEDDDEDKPAEGETAAPAKLKKKLSDMKLEDLLDVDLNKIDAVELAAAVTRISALLRPKELEAIVRELLAGATMDGKPLLMDGGNGDPINFLMAGRTMDVWRLMFYSVQVNYPDFFSRRVAPQASAAASPSAT